MKKLYYSSYYKPLGKIISPNNKTFSHTGQIALQLLDNHTKNFDRKLKSVTTVVFQFHHMGYGSPQPTATGASYPP